MQRRRIVAAVAMVATAGAAAALTLPAVAGTGGSTGTTGGSASVARADGDLLAAMQRDLRIGGAEARDRLRRAAWASGVTAELRARTGAAYAGAWLDAGSGELTVAVTDRRLAAAVRATGAEAKVVRRSEHQLDTVKSQLDEAALRGARRIPGWYVDPASNSVVVLARPGAEDVAADLADAAGVPADTVRVVTTEEQPRTLFDVRGGDPFFINGQSRCSVGFSVTGGFVTAGHCGRQGSTTTGFNRRAQGTFVSSSFPGDDYGVVQVNGDWVPQPVVATTDSGVLPVAGSQEAPVGAAVCRTGSTTGTRCGVIQAKNVTVNYPEGRVTGLTRTNVCAEPGDSGGAWLSGDQAQGITSGGSGNCTVGGTTFFQPVNEVLANENLTLTTVQAGQPAPEPTAPAEPTAAPVEPTPPAQQPTAAPVPPGDGACAESAVVRQGTLRGAGAGQLQPRGGFFRAQAGRHTACLTGPAGANFDLLLLRWTGRGWAVAATSAGPGSAERLTFDGPAGSYRYLVRSAAGAGGYTLGFSAP